MAAVTLADVAHRAGVSVATASRVLSASRPVGDRSAAKVRAAAAELGYAGNGIARALRTRRSDTIGMVVPSILNPFFATLVDSMERVLHGAGKQLLLCDARQDPEVEAEHLRLLAARHVDGIVVSACHDSESVAAVTAAAAAVPLVQLDRRIEVPGTDWVGMDDDAGLGLLLEHLRSRGARTAAFVTSELTNSSTADRLRGFRRHAAAAGLRTSKAWTVLGEFSVASGEAAARRLLGGAGPRPDAIVCADDLIAIGVLRGCAELGLSVPHDVQVTGIDDIEYAAYVSPALTTLAQPTARMAAEVLRLLDLRAGEGRDAPTRISFAPRLVVRASTRAEHEAPLADAK